MKILEEKQKSSGTKPWRAITYEENNNGCWICTSHKPSNGGYPRIRRNGKLMQLHRYIYSKYKGKIPKGYCIMHTCDNRMCINPEHLIAGTIADNNEDMWEKGRNFPWPPKRTYKAVLTPKQVLNIRKLLKTETVVSIAKKYKVNEETIRRIKLRRTHKNVK